MVEERQYGKKDTAYVPGVRVVTSSQDAYLGTFRISQSHSLPTCRWIV